MAGDSPSPSRTFLPELLDRRAGVRPHQADGVGAGHHVIQLVQHHVPGRVQVNVLAHNVGGLDVEGQPGDDAERAETDRESGQIASDRSTVTQRPVTL